MFIILELQPVLKHRPLTAINSQRSDPTCYIHPMLLLFSLAIFLWQYIFCNPFFTCPWLWQWRFSISRYTYYYYRYRTTRPRDPSRDLCACAYMSNVWIHDEFRRLFYSHEFIRPPDELEMIEQPFNAICLERCSLKPLHVSAIFYTANFYGQYQWIYFSSKF